MEEYQHQAVKKAKRLKAEAGQIRAQAMLMQIAAGLTLCGVAESELQAGDSKKAREIVEKLRKLAGTVRRHLNEPNHVPSDAVERISTELGQMDSRILAIGTETSHRKAKSKRPA